MWEGYWRGYVFVWWLTDGFGGNDRVSLAHWRKVFVWFWKLWWTDESYGYSKRFCMLHGRIYYKE